MGIENITSISSIWETFSFPIFNALIICTFLYVINGHDDIVRYIHSNWIKREEVVFKKKFIYTEKGERKILYVPINNVFITLLRSPAYQVIALFIIVYALHEIIFFFSNFYPIDYFYEGSVTFLNSVDEATIVEIWSYYPDYELETLFAKIINDGQNASYVQYNDTRLLVNLCAVVQICSMSTPIWIIISAWKSNWKMLFRSIICLIVSLFLLFGLYLAQFHNIQKIIKQSTYYVVSEMKFEGRPDVFRMQIASDNLDSEKLWSHNETGFGISVFGKDYDFCYSDNKLIPFVVRSKFTE